MSRPPLAQPSRARRARTRRPAKRCGRRRASTSCRLGSLLPEEQPDRRLVGPVLATCHGLSSAERYTDYLAPAALTPLRGGEQYRLRRPRRLLLTSGASNGPRHPQRSDAPRQKPWRASTFRCVLRGRRHSYSSEGNAMRTLIQGGWVVGFNGRGHELIPNGSVAFQND